MSKDQESLFSTQEALSGAKKGAVYGALLGAGILMLSYEITSANHPALPSQVLESFRYHPQAMLEFLGMWEGASVVMGR